MDEADLEKARLSLEPVLKNVGQKISALPAGGAFLKYPKKMPEGATRIVQLGIGQGDASTTQIRREIGETIIEYLPKPAAFDKLEAEITSLEAGVQALFGSRQLLRDGAQWLTWKWRIRPCGPNDVTLSVSLTSIDKVDRELYQTSVWPYLRNPVVEISVFKDSRSILKMLFDMLVNKVLIGGVLVVIIASWLTVMFGIET